MPITMPPHVLCMFPAFSGVSLARTGGYSQLVSPISHGCPAAPFFLKLGGYGSRPTISIRSSCYKATGQLGVLLYLELAGHRSGIILNSKDIRTRKHVAYVQFPAVRHAADFHRNRSTQKVHDADLCSAIHAFHV